MKKPLLLFLGALLFLASLPLTYYVIGSWQGKMSLTQIVWLTVLLILAFYYLLSLFFKPDWLLLVFSFISLLAIFFIRNPAAHPITDDKITVTLLQINDVYEIVALDEGRSGGLARVAALKKELCKDTGAFFTVLAGDFLSPSAIGTLRDNNNERILGLQMVDVLNATGVDLVTFGNHEFDLDRRQLQKCIDRSAFNWVSSNTSDSVGPAYNRDFYKSANNTATAIPQTYIKEFTDADGTKMKIGFFGLTVKSTAGGYISYKDYDYAAGKAIENLKGNCDLIIALTHLSLNEDTMIAARHPEIAMVIGGHEHVNSHNMIGAVPIAKADANARTVYVHTLQYDRTTGAAKISSELKTINDKIRPDTVVNNVVRAWNLKADSLLRKNYNPCRTIASLPGNFDGTENIRLGPTNLTLAISKSMVAAVKNNPPATAIYNSGTIRLDDMLSGNVTEYDIFRTIPYDNQIYVATLPGALLSRLLDVSSANKTDGCFLQYDTSVIIRGKDSIWRFNGQAMTANSMHRIAINWYLLSGRQDKMKFMGDVLGKLRIEPPTSQDTLQMDMRRAIISYFQKTYPPKSQEKLNRKVPCYPDQ